jgi:hypothetical protein
LLSFEPPGKGVGDVAMHRLPPGVKTPAELLTFRREEWMATDDESSWGPAFRRWQVARHAWVETHPDSELGDLLDVLRGEVQMKRGLWEWVP